MSTANLRQDYRAGELRRADLDPNPFAQFQKWFQEAQSCGAITEPNAMSLATAETDGRVSARTVLLKAYDEKGFVFYTNLKSSKSRQLSANPHAALLFPWLPLERQISISGRAVRVTLAETAAYFASRPFSSRIGAWVSQQSQIITSRKLLEMKFEEMRRKFSAGEVPLPDFWGGWRIIPETIEFWQGRTSRLHDRFLYTHIENGWQIDRLAP